jgi:glucose/arabinose dehydrogenase
MLEFLQVGRAHDALDNESGILMPARGGNPNLTDDDLLDIIAYLRTLENGFDVEDEALLVDVPQDTGVEVESPYQWVPVVDNLDSPLQVISPQDGTDRLFAVEQNGYILVIEDGSYGSVPFLDLTRQIPDSVYHGGYTEQGLLGLVFHPNYEENGQFFVSYINLEGDSVISRFTVSAEDPNRADPTSEEILLTVEQPFEDHNGGNIVFGPDGYLYIGFGDGGRPAEPNYYSQDPDVFLGKMLRLDVNGDPYSVPPDNPFVSDERVPAEVWALGLRNPWRFSFDRATGDLYIGDVGQWIYEEINFQPADSTGGENYGWSAFEASQPYLEDETLSINTHTEPILEYTHDVGCSVTGGYVYRGEALPELQGRYIYGDYCNGNVWSAQRGADGVWQSELLMATDYIISSFGEDAAGELYLVDYKGAIYRLAQAE